ncbi:MAG: hypothetical protein NC218_02020 [Acetobacter sp.]|nr:hypothetical protein [Acetobacter sp.]
MEQEMLFWTDGQHRVFAQAISQQTDTHIQLVNRKRLLPKELVGSKKPYYGNVYFYTFAEVESYLNPTRGYETQYMMLDRLRSDCEYFLAGGCKAEKLWAGNVKDQIAKMRELYEEVPEKPYWLTAAQIDSYEKLMEAA